MISSDSSVMYRSPDVMEVGNTTPPVEKVKLASGASIRRIKQMIFAVVVVPFGVAARTAVSLTQSARLEQLVYDIPGNVQAVDVPTTTQLTRKVPNPRLGGKLYVVPAALITPPRVDPVVVADRTTAVPSGAALVTEPS